MCSFQMSPSASCVLGGVESEELQVWCGNELGVLPPMRSLLSIWPCHSRSLRDERVAAPGEAAAFVGSLKACTKNKDLHRGTQLHHSILKAGQFSMCSDALVTMYAHCGALEKARKLLDMYQSKHVVSWTALIAGYVRAGLSQDALILYDLMQHEGIPPDAVTYASILKACGTAQATEKGKQIHEEIVTQGLLQSNIVLGNALVDMYARCGALEKALHVLLELPTRDVISWSTLITHYAQHGQGNQALRCFERMQCEGVAPNVVTFVCVLKACGTMNDLEAGKQIDQEIVKRGLLRDNVVLGGALIDMYAKCNALLDAQRVLEELPSRNVICWNTLIAGYAQHGQGEQALKCFECMQLEGILPDAVTYASILKASGSIGAADKGKQIHDEIMSLGLLENDIVLGNALVDMYAKCGSLAKAQHVLDNLSFRNVVSWNTLITAYAQQGQGKKALESFECMQREGISPDSVTFRCVLSVCSHLGLVEEGHVIFLSMSTRYGMKADLEAYTCMIDLFGRAGHLEKAVRLIQGMPFLNNSAIWHALLGACRRWRDVDVGRWVFDQALLLDKRDGAAYILMADIYAAAGMQENAQHIEALRMEILTLEAARA